jgi:hypothetical protein
MASYKTFFIIATYTYKAVSGSLDDCVEDDGIFYIKNMQLRWNLVPSFLSNEPGTGQQQAGY